MTHLYIALVDTPGFFASLIRRFLKQQYVHVVLSLDAQLEEAYSVGRRNPYIPFFAGFERENKRKILGAFPTANYRICEIACSNEQKEQITRQLRKDYERRFSTHYAIAGLLFLVCNKPFYQKNHYTCSSYLAKVLEENGMDLFQKHFSLVTPKDFYEYPDAKVIFEGRLEELVSGRDEISRRVVSYES